MVGIDMFCAAQSDKMASSSILSYAQAAKGHGVSPSVGSATLASQHRDVASPTMRDISIESMDLSQRTKSRSPAAVKKHETDNTIDCECDPRSTFVYDRRSEYRLDDNSRSLDQLWRRTDKCIRCLRMATPSVDEQKSGDGKNSDHASEVDKGKDAAKQAPKVELREAPVPSVNFWHWRMKQQQSNSKLSIFDALFNDPSSHNGDPNHNGDPKKSAKDSTSLKENISRNSHFTSSNRNYRYSRFADNVGEKRLPLMKDAPSGPTPQTVAKEERKKPVANTPASAQATEPQDIGTQNKRPKGKLGTYEYVPSFRFETKLPQMHKCKHRINAVSANSGETARTDHQSGAKASTSTARSEPIKSTKRVKDNAAGSNLAFKQASTIFGTVTKGGNKATAPTGNAANRATSTRPFHSTDSTRSEGQAESGRNTHQPIKTRSQHPDNGSSFSKKKSATGRPQGSRSQTYLAAQHVGHGRQGSVNTFPTMSFPNSTTGFVSIQTQFGSCKYPVPLDWDKTVMAVLKTQIEYYFSIENLCKDMYLRTQMDVQGFVNLPCIAVFKRIRELTSDLAMIRVVCESSTELEFVVGEDAIGRLRRRNGWQNFVLPSETAIIPHGRPSAGHN